MKYIYLLLLVAAAQANVIQEVQDISKIFSTVPQVTNIVIFENRGVTVFSAEWNPIPSTADNPIYGYKATIIEEIAPDTNQYRGFQEITLHGSDQTLAVIGQLKIGLWYQLRVQAITADGYGPQPVQWGVKLSPPTNRERRITHTIIQGEYKE